MAAAAARSAVSIVTGAGTGIGRALALRLAQAGEQVIVTGRREEPLASLAAEAPEGKIEVCRGDVTAEVDRTAVVEQVGDRTVKYLVHNAGVLGQIETAVAIPEAEFRRVMEINTFAPLFFTRQLLPKLGEGSRILQVSSGAAHMAIDGWLAYCTSKAALHMIYAGLRDELKPQGIAVGSVRPGIVDTEMQAHIRTGDVERFSHVQKFRDFKANMAEGEAGNKAPPAEALNTPENVALFMSWLLAECPAEEFSAKEWDIRDDSHHGQWAKQ